MRKTAADAGWNTHYIFFGYALYCTREDFAAIHREFGDHSDYDAVRSEAAPAMHAEAPDFPASALIPTIGGSGASTASDDDTGAGDVSNGGGGNSGD